MFSSWWISSTLDCDYENRTLSLEHILLISRSDKINLKLKIKFVRIFLWLFFGILFTILLPKPAISAERIYLLYGPFKFSLSVEALEIYATEGRITSEFAFYANRFDEPTLLQLRQMLQKRYYLNQVTVYRYRTSDGASHNRGNS